ncbi:hypothetical protein AB833_14995 [Chromatiales bacterium (ex Bugula neritina AB1)]|nr:hypothetical protein AB833_14995 [Chromatiales bacterium (ex Bugula neritina AB1)]
MHKFDDLYAISDTHFGGVWEGASNFQVFDNGVRLAAFIKHITTKNSKRDIALVINGDMIDSLAEPDVSGYVALDERSAIAMMNRLYDDPAFSPVWDALGEFIKTARHHLILLLGNHDLELALPVVEHSLRKKLAGSDSRAQARMHFCTHGTGYKCAVGDALVYCTHGNEFDDWNWVDQNKLSQLANAMSSGRYVDPDEWKPNTGTRLVVDVMNTVKHQYPFVDLLKPEKAAVAAVLLALDNDLLSKIDLGDALPIFWDKAKSAVITRRVLSIEDVEPTDIEATAADVTDILGSNMKALVSRQPSGGNLLADAIDALDYDEDLTTGPSENPEVLGVGDIIAGKLGLVEKHEALRNALLDWTADENGFDPSNSKDNQFNALQGKVGKEIDFVITGHTHLCKSLSMASGAHYFNTGTWIRLLKFTGTSLYNKERFKKEIWPALLSGRMSDLDSLEIASKDGDDVPLRFDRTNAAHIYSKDKKTFGCLYRVEDANGGKVKLDLEEDTAIVESR